MFNFNGFSGIPGLWEMQSKYPEFDGGFFDDIQEFNLLTYYYNLFLTRYKYEGIPESIKRTMYDLSNLDRWLWYAPAVCFFEDPVAGLTVLPCTNQANFNLAFFPSEWTVYGANGYQRSGLNASNSVLVFNDKSRVAPILYIYKYVRKIVELEKTANVNIDFQKNPFLLEIDEEQEKSAKKLFTERSNFKKLILTRRKSGRTGLAEGLKPNSLKVEYEADRYLSTIDKYENKILTYMGYNSVQIEKAERLITSEADANNEKTRAQFTAGFECRKSAFDRVNEMFGANIKIAPNSLTRLKDAGDAKTTPSVEEDDETEV